jgi:hypothetical protein
MPLLSPAPNTHQPTLELIRQRFDRGRPLNLSAVKREAPELLNGLWNPLQFVGWRQMLEAAGLSYDRIRFILEPNALCPLCRFGANSLTVHINEVHGISAQELRKTDPGVEIQSEESRAARFDYHHGRKSKTLLPHWEKAWSLPYALERVRWMYDLGMPVNYSTIADGEPGLAAYLRRLLGSWDKALEACGIVPQAVRIMSLAQTFTKSEVVSALQEQFAMDPHSLHISRCRVAQMKALFSAVFREYTTLEDALRAAGIDPHPLVPALLNPAKLTHRSDFLALVRARIQSPPTYVASEVASFLKTHRQIIRDFWGDWPYFAKSIKRTERDIFNPPAYTKYLTKRNILEAIRERRRVGLPLQDNEVRTDNSALLLQAMKCFGNWRSALAAAKVKRAPRMLEQRRFTPATLITYLQEKAAVGTVMWSSTFQNIPSERIVLKWAIRYFGSWQGALAKAGISSPPQSPNRGKNLPKREKRFANPEAILDGIRLRVSEGKSLLQLDLAKTVPKGGDVVLVRSARTAFGSWPDALVAAGIGPTQ